MRIYARTLGVGEYFLFDPFSGVLEGYELDGAHGSYVPKTPDENGRFLSVRTGLFLGRVRSVWMGYELDWLRWIHPDGRLVRSSQDLAVEAQARLEVGMARVEAREAELRAMEERARAAEERAARLEAKLEELEGRR
jgi:hypothetical protein